MFENYGIYQYQESSKENKSVLVFSSFEDEETVLAVPLEKRYNGTGIPLLYGDQIRFVMYCDMFRMYKNELITAVGRVEADAMETIIQRISSAFRGEIANAVIPTATLFDTDEKIPQLNKVKYTRKDYDFIMQNYKDSPNSVIEKYKLKDKQALSRLRYYLNTIYGKSSEVIADSEDAEGG